MALIKIYAEADRLPELRLQVAKSSELVVAAALNVPGVETTMGHVETVHDEALVIGRLSPGMTPQDVMKTGEIGYIVTNLKTTREAKVGDTVALKKYFDKGVN